MLIQAMIANDTLKTSAPHFSEVPDIRSKDIRGITSQLAHPQHPLANWKAEFAEWIKAFQDFREIEQTNLFDPATPSPYHLRQHRYLLFLLMSKGEKLVLDLTGITGLSDEERAMQTEYVDAFLRDLEITWLTWHREPSPVHQAMLAPFLGK